MLESPCALVVEGIHMEVAVRTHSQALQAASGSPAAACHSRALALAVAPLVAAGGTGDVQRLGRVVVVLLLARLGVGYSCKQLMVQVELGMAVAHNRAEEEARQLVGVPWVLEQMEAILEDQRRDLHPGRCRGPGHAVSSPQYAPVVDCQWGRSPARTKHTSSQSERAQTLCPSGPNSTTPCSCWWCCFLDLFWRTETVLCFWSLI